MQYRPFHDSVNGFTYCGRLFATEFLDAQVHTVSAQFPVKTFTELFKHEPDIRSVVFTYGRKISVTIDFRRRRWGFTGKLPSTVQERLNAPPTDNESKRVQKRKR